MSFGGDFYAFSDKQLRDLLDGEVNYWEFLDNQMDEKPRECFSKGEHVWFEISQMLEPEHACGMENTNAIPEMSGYSFSDDVKSIVEELVQLSEEELRERHGDAKIEQNFEPLYQIIKELMEFYQRAAKNNDAVLFRLT
ncbi:MAG: DUF1877 family protein [Candidatus Contendobacter sp.]|nr:DUF1877 family protein [Candidatus Contendobacter sp.]MDS4060068.1 DUF1877 family protein [Candidatus Contendobacter sp.]